MQEWGTLLHTRYAAIRRAVRQTRRNINAETRRAYADEVRRREGKSELADDAARLRHGPSLRYLNDHHPDLYLHARAEIESQLDHTLGGRPKWLYRFGLRRLVDGLIAGAPWEVALVLLALKHRRSTHTIYQRIQSARSHQTAESL